VPRTCGGYELRGVVPSWSQVDGSAPADSPPRAAGRFRARESGERIQEPAMLVKCYYKRLVNGSNGRES